MDKNPLIAKLNKEVPGAILESRRFGRSGITSIWLESESIVQVARCLQTLPELMMDWLENFSLVEFEDVLVATYFVTSSKTKQSLILRVSAVPDSPTTRVQFSSVRSVWPMAEPMEKEAEDLFGIIFKKEPDASGFVPEQETRSHLLPENWVGFPLRKGYVFPTEVYGLSHSSKNKRDLDKEVVPQ